jgi:hypothetical protein
MKLLLSFVLCLSFLVVPLAAQASDACATAGCPFSADASDNSQNDDKSAAFHNCVHSHVANFFGSIVSQEPVVESLAVPRSPAAVIAKPIASGPYKPPRLA